ncbi:MAG TPA: hypothetical protein VKA19_02265 [Alphaproteobacteria bacterium]|nr:hypothetical protein [Alphaproteobacteria bacterium]
MDAFDYATRALFADPNVTQPVQYTAAGTTQEVRVALDRAVERFDGVQQVVTRSDEVMISMADFQDTFSTTPKRGDTFVDADGVSWELGDRLEADDLTVTHQVQKL